MVTAFIVHVGWEVTTDVVRHLLDGVDRSVLEAAEGAALSVGGVEHVHVRGRWLGRTLVVDVEGFVAPDLRVEEAESLGQAVRGRIAEAVPQCRSVQWTARAIV